MSKKIQRFNFDGIFDIQKAKLNVQTLSQKFPKLKFEISFYN